MIEYKEPNYDQVIIPEPLPDFKPFIRCSSAEKKRIVTFRCPNDINKFWPDDSSCDFQAPSYQDCLNCWETFVNWELNDE